MTVTRISPSSLDGGPSVYSNAVLCEGTKKILYVAGQVGVDDCGHAGEGIEEQCRQAWSNVQSILDDAGMTLHDIVKLTVYLTDPSDYPAFVKVRSEVLKENKPASTVVCVSCLVRPEWRVEIEAVASC